MTSTIRNTALKAAFVLSTAAVAVGCSSGSAAVSTDDLESAIADFIEENFGVSPESVDCPDTLSEEVGSVVVCTATAEGDTAEVTLTSSGLNSDSDKIEFQIELVGSE